MRQSKVESLIEACLNVGSGFVIAALFMHFVITPLFNLQTNAGENLTITVLFTFISIARGYAWRRFFATEVHRAVVKFVRERRIGNGQV